MNPFQSLFVALLDTVVGLLTFNLPMSRVPHSISSAVLVIVVVMLSSILEAAFGNYLPALVMIVAAVAVAADRDHRKSHRMTIPDGPSRVIATTYVLGMTGIASVAMRFSASVALPGHEFWTSMAISGWMVMVLITMLPSIERHQRQLLAAQAEPNTGDAASSASKDASGSSQP